MGFVAALDGFALDHVVRVVDNPQETRLRFERELGIHTVPGGDLDGHELTHGQAMLPFVIEWADDDQTRLLALRASGAVPATQGLQLVALHTATDHVGSWPARFLDCYFHHTESERGEVLRRDRSGVTDIG
ncbi:hypothetical protein [Alicyclobacillus acidiphilus]|uniref:hypothetical protein n=1 Tax=Alicyclobacillus acidiphilus TaxID=182455 RepID=UPI00082EF582|nr:hypothetical protein [Alicyclobacillus acidiphilus]